MKSLDALWEAMLAPCYRDFPNKPGAVIERLPKQLREAIQKLTSNDAQKMRFDA